MSSSLGSSSVLYKLKEVEFRGRKVFIVCHDRSSAYYFPLPDFYNYFVLEKDYIPNPKFAGVDTISQSDLVQEFIRIVNSEIDFLRSHPEEKPKDFDYFFPSLGSGNPFDAFPYNFSKSLLGTIYIHPVHTKWTDDFAATLHTTGLQCIKFPLHHGWIVDPVEKQTVLAAGSKSAYYWRRNKNTLPLVKSFVQNSISELTKYGISCLDAEILEGQVAGLYRNGRIDLMCKHAGDLYVLITEDHESPTAMWKSLCPVYQDEVYFTSDFVPLPADAQPNENGKKWLVHRAKIERDKDKKRLKKLQQRQPQLAQTNIESPHFPNTTIPSPISEPDDLLKPPSQGQQSEVTSEDVLQAPVIEPFEIPWEECVFQNFLEEYIYDAVPGEINIPFFEAQIECMKRVRCFDFCVRYTDIEKFSRELAIAIRNDKIRLTQLLTQVAIKFMIAHEFADEGTIIKKANLIIHDIPEPLCIQTFLEFIAENRLVQPYLTHLKKFINSTTYIGRKMGVGYVEDITKNHKEKKSWGGDFDVSDLKVINGRFVIDKPATKTLTRENGWLDFEKYITKMSEYYKTKDVPTPPPYFENFLGQVMLLLPDPQKNLKLFEAFERYLCKCQFAFKAPLVRSTVLREMFVVCQMLRPRNKDGRRLKGYVPLDWVAYNQWNDKLKFEKPYCDVYWHDNDPFKDKFGAESLWGVLSYSRYFTEHLVDHTLVESLLIADLMLGDRIGDAVGELIWHMTQTLYDGPFSDAWTHFEKSDYDDAPRSVLTEGSVSVPAEGSTSMLADRDIGGRQPSPPAEGLASVPAEDGAESEESAPVDSDDSVVSSWESDEDHATSVDNVEINNEDEGDE